MTNIGTYKAKTIILKEKDLKTLVGIVVEVNDVFKDIEKTTFWLNTSNYNLGGIKPIVMIRMERSEKLLQCIKALKDGE